jgi:transcriptional regulator with XRE-family HTH domain
MRTRRKRGLQALVLGAMTPVVLRIRDARLKKGWTQTELAKRAGVRRATINQLESRRAQRVNLETLGKIAKALGVATLTLLRETRP